MKKELNKKLQDIYGTRTVDTQRALYKDWAGDYEADSVGEFGYVGFKTGAAEFAKRVPDKSARILDAGCGTGLSGRALAEEGYTNIHGLDLSPEMLEVASRSGVYQSLAEADLTQPVEVAEPYDAIFSAGLFGFGPPDPEHLHLLLNVLKPGGTAVITVNGKGWDDKDWENRLPAEVDAHQLDLVETLEIPYLENEDIRGILLVFNR